MSRIKIETLKQNAKLIGESIVLALLTSYIISVNFAQFFDPTGKSFSHYGFLHKTVWVLLAAIIIGIFIFAAFHFIIRRHSQDAVFVVLLVILIFFLVFPVSPNLFTVDPFTKSPCCRDADIDFFYSFFHIVSRGGKIYADVMDIKDPVFLYSNSIFYLFFGQKGPMLLELLLSITMIISLGVIGSRLKLHPISLFVLIVIFVYFALSPPAYMPIHTYQQPICLFLVLISLTFSKRTPINAIICGLLFTIIFFTKLLFLLVFPAVLIAVVLFDQFDSKIQREEVFRKLLFFGIGMISGLVLFLILMAIRGELNGYLYMNKLQFAYSQTKASLGFPDDTTIEYLTKFLGRFFVIVLAAITISCFCFFIEPILMIKKVGKQYIFPSIDKKLVYVSLFSFFTIIGIMCVMFFTHMWSHHLQPMSIAVSMGMLPILLFSQIKKKPFYFHILILLIAVCFLRWFKPYSSIATVFGKFTPSISIAFTEHVYWPQSGELNSILADLHDSKQRDLNYVVLQHNLPGHISTILPDYLRFNCVFLSQYPFFGPFDEFIGCMKNENIDIIFKWTEKYWFNMPDLEKGIQEALKQFQLVLIYDGYEVYVRK